MSRSVRLVAFYLPQFHPIPENDAWWGAGFTEWTNVMRARPLFRGHYQPRLPADLGFYDLRVPEVREAQAELARQAGIEGFAYYHYWFAGKRLLERPFAEVVATGRPDFPFCLCWANQTWSGIWHGAPSRILIEQTYPGESDNERHFMALLDAFTDERYIKVEGKPLFIVYRPLEIPDPDRFTSQWRELAVRNGLPGLHFVAQLYQGEWSWDYSAHGFDAAVVTNFFKGFNIRRWTVLLRRLGNTMPIVGEARLGPYLWSHFMIGLRRRIGGFPGTYLYEDAIRHFENIHLRPDRYPTAIPNWDNTPRSGQRGLLLHDSKPELFAVHLNAVVASVADRPLERRLVFIKSWNEWAEGNYLEPDQKFGHRYLDVVRNAILADGATSGRAPTADPNGVNAGVPLTHPRPFGIDPPPGG